jgi:hypothetical protein
MDAATAFYGVHLSDNIAETEPEKYLICRNTVIGRTGKQTYRYADLPQAEAADLEIEGNPNDLVDLYRDPEDVFDPVFIASLEGKPVTDLHPPKLLDLDSVMDHSVGHMFNVRPGVEPLDSGDMPLLADLMIVSKNLIAKIKSGLRELSCGYTYHIALDGPRILQVDMTGNHVAVLPSGRAGREACISDGEMPKEKRSMKFLESFGEWLQNLAKTATPEELAEAAKQHPALTAATAMDGKGKRGKTSAAAAKDADDEHRAKMHSALDRILDRGDEEDNAADADEAELRELMTSGANALDAKDDDEDDDCDDEGKAEDGEDDDDEEGEAEDEEIGELPASEIIPVGDRAKPAAPGLDGKKGKSAKDGKMGKAMDAADVLRKLRPAIARSKDPKVRAAFDQAVKESKPRGVRKGGAGYGAVAAAAGRAMDSKPNLDAESAAMTAAYAKRHRKGLGEK